MKVKNFLKTMFVALFCLCIAGSLVIATNAEAATKAQKKIGMTEAEANDGLRDFAVTALGKMNALVIPSKSKKEIIQNSDGSWTARYTEVDVTTLNTSVRVPEDQRYVQYVGYMRYVDVEYVCKAASKEAALAGPFQVKSKEGLTELVKCMNGKWGY